MPNKTQHAGYQAAYQPPVFNPPRIMLGGFPDLSRQFPAIHRTATRRFMKKFDEQLVSGSILRSVWKLAWPATLLNLVNGMHSFVDHVLVGHFVVSDANAANAAIGVAWQTFLIFVVFIASLFHGMNVLIARYAGRQDRANMSRVAYETFLASLIILLFIVAPAGYIAAPYLLDLVGAEAEVRMHALPYLRILFTCGAPLFISFMFTGAFQASGDPKTPLVLGILATMLNIGISAVLITGIGPFPQLGAIGAAIGTVLAPLFTVAISVTLVLRRKMVLQPPAQFRLWPDLSVIKVVRIGIHRDSGRPPQQRRIPRPVFLGRMSHDISAPAMAAYHLCYAQLFSLVTWTCFGLRSASGTLMGRHRAGNPRLGKRRQRRLHRRRLGRRHDRCWFYPPSSAGLFDARASRSSRSASLLRFSPSPASARGYPRHDRRQLSR